MNCKVVNPLPELLCPKVIQSRERHAQRVRNWLKTAHTVSAIF